MIIPKTEQGILKLAADLQEQCGVSMGSRGAAYQQYSQLVETGRDGGGLSLANRLYAHIDRLASHLFCPTDARFMIDFQNIYNKNILLQAQQASRIVTRDFSRHNFDLTFSEAIPQSLTMGASFIKLGGKTETIEIKGKPFVQLKEGTARIVPPWLMGVENEGKNGLSEQEAIMETVFLNKHDVWRRISHLPDAQKLYKRILSHSNKTSGPGVPSSFVQVLSTSVLNISPQGSQPPSPGGIVQIAGDPGYSTMGPQVMSDQYQMNEFWVWDDMRSDWLMIQVIAPDVLIAPLYKRSNTFCDNCLPYIMLQPNVLPGYFWGRSEIVDMITLQLSLSQTMDDFKRLMGVQYDKRLAFEGFDGDPQEMYDDFRSNGWINGRAGAKVNDLTPQIPAAALEYINLLIKMMDDVGGFGNIMSGQGESGVRAGSHANQLMKTASPRLRDRSLIVERQYATMGDTYLHYLEQKDATQYCYDSEKPDETAFLMADLPDDRRVTVDSHSSSPVYEQDHTNLAAFGFKAGLIGGDRAIDMLNFPDKDEAKREFKEREAAKAKFVQDHPEVLTKGKGKK